MGFLPFGAAFAPAFPAGFSGLTSSFCCVMLHLPLKGSSCKDMANISRPPPVVMRLIELGNETFSTSHTDDRAESLFFCMMHPKEELVHEPEFYRQHPALDRPCCLRRGLVCIIKGGDLFVDAASWIAEASGIPKFIIGATIVSFATTLPEMLVSVFAALEGNADIAVGNAVGSVTANTGLIMCLSLVCMTCADEPQTVRREGLPAAGGDSGAVRLHPGRPAFRRARALLILVIFAGFLAESLISARREQGTERKTARTPRRQRQNRVRSTSSNSCWARRPSCWARSC